MSRKKGRKDKTQGAQAAGARSIRSNVVDTATDGGNRENTGGEKPQDSTSYFVPLSRGSSRASIVSAALAQAGDSDIGRKRGSLDRGTLAQCLNATSQIAAECNRILRELLRGAAGMREVGERGEEGAQGGQGGRRGIGGLRARGSVRSWLRCLQSCCCSRTLTCVCCGGRWRVSRLPWQSF